ncbi:MAG TPA: hypothetical protein VFJ17_12150 [Mycobacteriales bacterium]|jgi:hypothetical protein|nr:hypothetical protein [Mycobacteriales bacterium]
MSVPQRIAKWIAPERNPQNTVYGTIAAGLLLAAEDPSAETYTRVVTATVIAVASYWLAHGYAHWVGQRFGPNAGSGRAAGGLAGALLAEWPLAEGASIPLAALVVAWAAGATLTIAVQVAVWTAAAAVIVFEVVGGLRRRLPAGQLLANAAIGLALASALLSVKLVLN